jgi:hypothetical protein
VDLDDLERRLRGVIRVPPPAYGGALLFEEPVGALARDADQIMIARVAEAQARLTPNAESIETVVTLDVEQDLKGAAGSRRTLVLPGGRVGDVQVIAGGVPQFWPDERLLLFLRTRGLRPTLAGPWQGKYSLIDGVAAQPESGRAVPLALLTARIADALARVGLRQDDDGPRLVEAPFTTFCLPWSPAQTPVPFFANPTSGGTGAPGGPRFLQLVHEAVQAWQDIPAAWVSGRLAGMTSRPGTNHLDGHHDVAWADLDVFGPQVLAVNFCSMAGGVRIHSDTLLDTTGPITSGS